MNRILLSLIFTLAFHSVSAQTTVSVSGKLMSEGEPVEFANVILTTVKDTSTVVQFAITNTEGMFTLEKIPFGEYRLTSRFIGYKTAITTFVISENMSSIDLGVIAMEADVTVLGAVTITAQRKLIQKTSEGFVINAASNITQAGGTATDLLRSAPTVHVNDEGGITLRGKTPLILINGRSSSLANTGQIAASSVESIEIITNPSAKYDASAESGIINIILKKNKQSGTNGAFALGAG